jgi:hypothetical protein
MVIVISVGLTGVIPMPVFAFAGGMAPVDADVGVDGDCGGVCEPVGVLTIAVDPAAPVAPVPVSEPAQPTPNQTKPKQLKQSFTRPLAIATSTTECEY